MFAGWNLVETIPDATLGNLKAGKRLTTEVFDKGQVFLDYLTDILPGGDAWIRVHSDGHCKPEIFRKDRIVQQ